MDTILSVTTADLARLGPRDAVAFFSRLLWAEATRVGLPVTRVNISSRIDVPDGGVDAIVTGADALPASDLFVSTSVAYQIKSGHFKPWQPAVVTSDLFANADSADTLPSQIRSCLDAGGTYVLVCTGVDLTSEERGAAVEAIKRHLAGCGYADPHVDVHSQNQLRAMLQRFPSLSLSVNGRNHHFRTHASWARDAEMRSQFRPGPEQDGFIATLRDALRAPNTSVHVHVDGEAGVGKTRLVLEATREPDIEPLVVYCDRPSRVLDGPLLNAIVREDASFSVLLVVDECDRSSRVQLWNLLKNRGTRIKLVTIFNEPCEATGGTRLLHAPRLGDEQIAAILADYGIPGDQSGRWCDFCGGSARVAHALGANLRSNPEDVLRSPDTVNIWDRFVAGGDRLDSVEVQQRHTVLRYLALFRRFGYGREVAAEAKALAKLIEEADGAITFPRFQAIVKSLKDRHLLRGEHTLYITPRLLHIRLWKDWWETHGTGVEIQRFSALPGRLPEWFTEMFEYAATSPVALDLARELLGPSGAFARPDYLNTAAGGALLLALTAAAPQEALDCLTRVIGNQSRDQLLEFRQARRHVINALERIVVWKDCFAGGARLLLQLAEAENEGWGNNATGVFAALFSPAPGRVAPTEAPPEARFPVLREALTSASPERRRAAIKACAAALETAHFSRMVGPEHQGVRPEPVLWMPEAWSEVFDAYRRVWSLLLEHLEALPDDERKEAAAVLIGAASGLTRYGNLVDEVIDTLTELPRKPWLDRKRLVEVAEYAARRGQHVEETRRRWEALKDGLRGSDFHSRLERYVGMTIFADMMDEEGHHTDSASRAVEELAAEAVAEPEKLGRELDWLMTEKASNGHPFGYALGRRDEQLTLLPVLVEAQRSTGARSNLYVLDGYFRALFERDRERWERELDSLSQDASLHTAVPEVTWRSGMTDRAAARVLSLAQQGSVAIGAFRMFGYGGVLRGMSSASLEAWVAFLHAAGTQEAASIALTLFFYSHKNSPGDLPRDIVMRVLTAPGLFLSAPRGQYDQMEQYYWTELAKALVARYPDEALRLAEPMVEHFGTDGTVVGGFRPQSYEVLESIASVHPREVWARIAVRLGPPLDDRSFHLRHWLREGAAEQFADDDIWAWVEDDVDKRAWIAAGFLPPILQRGGRCLAREVLVRYGDRDDVRSNLHANFGTEGFSGPPSLHYQKKAEALRAFREGETHPNVLRWLDEALGELEERVRHERVAEEREGF